MSYTTGQGAVRVGGDIVIVDATRLFSFFVDIFSRPVV